MHPRGGSRLVPRRDAHPRLDPDAWGQEVTGAAGNGSASRTGTRHVDAVDAGNLLAAFSGVAPVDYLLVNIESAWYEMLRHGQWSANVRCIKIEIQDHYDEAVPLLEALGYRVQLQRLSRGAFDRYPSPLTSHCSCLAGQSIQLPSRLTASSRSSRPGRRARAHDSGQACFRPP